MIDAKNIARLDLTSREDAFSAAYVADPKRNATAAAIAAGYAPASAHVTASRLLKRAKVQSKIAELEAVATEHARLTVADIVARYADIVRADPNDLTAYVVSACRHCHGRDHAWQWRTPDEFQRAVSAWETLPKAKRPRLPPADAGGFGYNRRLAPHPDCPECDGEGEGRVVLRDTRTDHPLYAGVRETRHGVEIRLHDKVAALETLARILGAFQKEPKPDGADNGLASFLRTLILKNQAQGIVLNRGGTNLGQDDVR